MALLDEVAVVPSESAANQDLLTFFRAMEFRALITKTAKALEGDSFSLQQTMPAQSSTPAAKETTKEEITFDTKSAYGKRDYKLVNTKAQIEEVIEKISGRKL